MPAEKCIGVGLTKPKPVLITRLIKEKEQNRHPARVGSYS